MQSATPPTPPAPPTEDELAALVGYRMPGGRALAEPYLDWLVRDALGAPQRAPGEEAVHPMVAFGLAQGGVGLGLEEVFGLFGSSSADGPMLGEWSLTLHRPLRAGAAYAVEARVEATRRTRGRNGVLDLATTAISLAPDGGPVEIEVRPTFVFPRPGPDPGPAPGGPAGRRRREPGAEPSGEPLPGFALEVRHEPMKVMAAVLRDPNMIHLDAAETARLGMGDRPVNQGPLNLGYLQTMLAGYAGGVDRIRATSFRFLGPVHAGDRVVAGGVVTGRSAGGVECAVWLDVEGGGRVVTGTAVLDPCAGSGSVRV